MAGDALLAHSVMRLEDFELAEVTITDYAPHPGIEAPIAA